MGRTDQRPSSSLALNAARDPPYAHMNTALDPHQSSGDQSPSVGHLRVTFWIAHSCSRFSAWLVCLFLLCGGSCSLLFADAPAQQLRRLQSHYSQIHGRFSADLETVAQTCDDEHLTEVAAAVRALSQSDQPALRQLDQLSLEPRAELSPDLPSEEHAAWVRVRKLQADYANDLYQLARKAIKEQHPSFAYRLVGEIMWHDPDHPQTRALLGYRRQGKSWTTPFALEMKKKGKVWHDEFGWILDKELPRYLAGERLYDGKWITAEREESLRSDFDNAWIMETEHFRVRTNHSLQKGVRLAASTELFRSYLMREFAAFFKKPQQLEKLFSLGASSGGANKCEIYYFRQRQEFVDRLIANCPIAGEINGIYMPSHRRAYFFHDPEISEEQSLDTLYHEVTHQLLSESTAQVIPVGHSRDFWVIEGIACYFESFRVNDEGTISVGDPSHDRINAAREQVTTNQDQEPLARFTAMGMKQFQTGMRPELQSRYAQAAGVTHFLMNFQGGLYRDGFVEYLTQVYSPDQRVRDRAKTLEQILGVPFATLDKQYADYFQSLTSQSLSHESRSVVPSNSPHN